MQDFRVYIWQKYEDKEDFITEKLDKIYSFERLSAKEVIYFLFSFCTEYVFSLVLKRYLDMKYKESLRLRKS